MNAISRRVTQSLRCRGFNCQLLMAKHFEWSEIWRNVSQRFHGRGARGTAARMADEEQDKTVHEVVEISAAAGADIETENKKYSVIHDADDGEAAALPAADRVIEAAANDGTILLDDERSRPSDSDADSDSDDPVHPTGPESPADKPEPDCGPRDFESVPSENSVSPKRDICYALVPIEGLGDNGQQQALTAALQARLERRKLGFPTSRPRSHHCSRPASRANEPSLSPLMLYESNITSSSGLPFRSVSNSMTLGSRLPVLQPLGSKWAEYDIGPSVSQQQSPLLSAEPSREDAGAARILWDRPWPTSSWPCPPREGSPAPRRRGRAGTPLSSRPGSRQRPRSFRHFEAGLFGTLPNQPEFSPPGHVPAADATLKARGLKQQEGMHHGVGLIDEKKEKRVSRKLVKAVCQVVLDGMLDALETAAAPFAVVTAQFASFAEDAGPQTVDIGDAQQSLTFHESLLNELSERELLVMAYGGGSPVPPTAPESPALFPIGNFLPGSVPDSPQPNSGSRTWSSGARRQHRGHQLVFPATEASLAKPKKESADTVRPVTAPIGRSGRQSIDSDSGGLARFHPS